VFIGNTVTKAQWDALRYDIINIRLHQDGVVPVIATVNVGDPIPPVAVFVKFELLQVNSPLPSRTTSAPLPAKTEP
jgi:hypothetical protein